MFMPPLCAGFVLGTRSVTRLAYSTPHFLNRHWESKLILALPEAKCFSCFFSAQESVHSPCIAQLTKFQALISNIRPSPDRFVNSTTSPKGERDSAYVTAPLPSSKLRNVKVTYHGSDWWVREGVVLAPGPLPSRFIPTTTCHTTLTEKASAVWQ